MGPDDKWGVVILIVALMLSAAIIVGGLWLAISWIVNNG
jgi:hypothetical protein